jgi:PAS domain S-box-containing protein
MRETVNGTTTHQLSLDDPLASRAVRVLLVSSNGHDAELLTNTLAKARRLHAELAHVEDLHEASARLSDGEYDAALVDLAGSSVLDLLLAVSHRAPGVPLIALVGLEDASLGVQSVMAGAQDYLIKEEINSAALERSILYSIDKKVDENLSLSEQRFRALFEQSPIPIHIFAADGRSMEVNDAWLDLYGFTREHVPDFNILQTDYFNEVGVMPYIHRAFAGEAVDLPTLFFDSSWLGAPNNRKSWLNGFAYPIKDQAGSVRQVVFVVDDVTEQKEAQDRLREKEEEYRAIFEATMDGLTINDMDGNVVEVNPAFAAMHGYTVDEMRGMGPRDFIHTDHLHVWAEGFAAFRAGATSAMGSALDIRKDGSAFPVEVHASLFTYRGKPHVLCVVLDTTEKVEAERLVRLKEEQYREVFEATTDGLVINDFDGNVVEVNPAFAAMHGYTHDEMIGMPPPTFIHPESHGLLQEFFETVQAGKQFQCEAMDVRKDGTAFPVEVHGSQFMYRGEPHILGVIRDIAERKKAEEAIKRSERKYEDLVNSLDSIVWEQDLQTGQHTFVSKQAERLLGYPVERWLAEPTFWEDHLHPEDRDSAYAYSAAAIAEMRPHELEYRMVAADGRVVWFRDIITLGVEDEGTMKLRGVMVDITEQKRIEQELRDSEEQYRAIFEAGTDGLTINTLSGELVEVNPAFAAMHGYTREEMEGIDPLTFIHPDDHLHVPLAFAAFAEGKQYHEIRGRDIRKDGTVFPIEIHGTRFTYRGEPHILCIVRDITERVEADRLLRAKEEQYRAVFQASVDGLAINDMEGYLVEVNPAFAAMHGYTPDELVGVHPTAFIHPDSQRELAEFFQAVSAGQTYQCEAVDVRKDGTPFPVHVIGTPFIYKGDLHTLAVVRDMMERKKAEEAAKRSERRYEDLVNSLDSIVYEWHAGRFSFVSRQAERLLGYPTEQWKTEPEFWSSHLHPEDRDWVVESSAVAIAERRPHELEYRMVAADGREVWIRDIVSMVTYENGAKKVSGIMLDVTRQKEIENDLRLKEEQYRAIFEATTDGLVIGSMDGLTVEANPAFAAMHGYTREELMGMDPREYIHPESRFGFDDFVRHVAAGDAYKAQAIDLRKDGTGFHVEVSGTIFTYQGEPHLLGIVRDITERVEADRLLRLQEEQYRAVFEASVDGLAIAELNAGTIVEVNPAWAKMHGYTREEMVGMHPTVFVHPDDYEVQAEFMEKVRRGERPHVEGRDVRKDGTVFNVEVYAAPFTYKDQPHVLAIMRDITERVEQQEQLRLKEEQYRAIFEATTDGLVISDFDGNVLEVNPAFAASLGYTREELVGMDPRQWIHPDSHANLVEYLKRVRAGERYHTEGLQVRKDGTVFTAEVHEAPFMYNGQLHTLAIIRDITERVQSRELLEQRVEERTRELQTLLEVSHNVASTLELRPLLGHILDQLKLLVDFSVCSIAIAEGGEMTVFDTSGPAAWRDRAKQVLGQRYSIEQLGHMGEAFRRGEAVIIPDVRSDDADAQAYRRVLAYLLKVTPDEVVTHLHNDLSYIRSWLGIPLLLKEGLVGVLTLAQRETGFYTERHAKLTMAVANQAAIAIENARLYEQAQANTRKTAALAQVASQVAYGGSLQSTLDVLCQRVVEVTGAMASAVVLRDESSQQLRMVGTCGLPEGYAPSMNRLLEAGTVLMTQPAFEGEKPMSLKNMRQAILNKPEYAPLHSFMHQVEWDTIVAMPMIYRGRPVGVLLSYHSPSHDIGGAEMTFHSVIADQAAVAVENARLLMQAHDKARLEERQRLARELHDSVTQALFSISLIARSAEVVMQREGTHSPQTMEKLADLRQLTQGALAEMRALIFELRPGALEEEGLYEALRKHAAAVQGREMIQVDINQGDDLPRLKPAAEEALYRITQEALHNIVKHARATRVEVCIESQDGFVVLRVTDDGVGFETDKVPAGHMGLGTMRQRTDALGGDYTVQSQPGEGTTITVRVPLREWQL